MGISQNLNNKLINNRLVRAIRTHDKVSNNKLEKIKTLIDKGADINAVENNPLCISIKEIKEDIIQLLLQQPNISIVPTRQNPSDPFAESIKKLYYLIHEGADTQENRAQISSMERIITEIIKYPNININQPLDNRMTPLHLISTLPYPNYDTINLLQSLIKYPNINLNAVPIDTDKEPLFNAPITHNIYVYSANEDRVIYTTDKILINKYQNFIQDPSSSIITSILINNGAVSYDPVDDEIYYHSLEEDVDGTIIDSSQSYTNSIIESLSPKNNFKEDLIFREELEEFINLYKEQFNKWSIDSIHERDLIAILSDHYQNNRTLLQEEFNNIISKGYQATSEDITKLAKIYYRCYLGQSYRAALTVFDSSRALDGDSINTETGMPANQQQYNERLEQYKSETDLYHQNNNFYNKLKDQILSALLDKVKEIAPDNVRGAAPVLDKIRDNLHDKEEIKHELVSYSFILDQASNRLGIDSTDERFNNIVKELADQIADHIIKSQRSTT